ncbi:MAG: hypothetical protein FJW40_12745 [Acidobacteria bacterium]|nr:hypothetical protein [Acidobacteriota bacterium]
MPDPTPRRYSAAEKMLGLAAVIFSFGIGFFLMLFPWLEEWNSNYFSAMIEPVGVWGNAYFRGAVSGVGVINIYISFLEVFRLRRFAETSDPE